MSRLAWLLFLVIAVMCVPALAQSQATTGVIEGRVFKKGSTDPLAKVEIVLMNTNTNYQKIVKSDSQGRFRGLLLPLGPYRLTAILDGYYIVVQENLRVTVGASVVLNIELQKIDDQKINNLLSQMDDMEADKKSEVMESITVTADEFDTVIETGRIESSTLLDEEVIQGIPNNGRNFLDFTLSTPGVTIVQGPDGDEISINGQKGINNNISVDGADFNNPFFGSQRGGQRPAFTFNLDAIQEVVVVSEGAPAEFGRSSAGFVNVITKSGTNTHGGTLHYFRKDDSMNDRAENPDGTKADKFDFSKNQMGFTFGGPLIKDKMFYFTSFDYQEGSSTKQTDPNRIEQRVVDYFDSIGFPNENGPIERNDDAHAFSFKVDWNLSMSHLLTMRYSDTSSQQSNGTFDVDSWGRSANAVEESSSRAFSAQLNSVITPDVINEFRIQWAREERPRPYNGANVASTGRPLPDTAFDFGRSYRFGMPFFIPVEYYDTRLQINNNLSIIRGNHLIKTGIEVNMTQAVQTFVGFANGRWIFSSTEGFLNYAANPNYVECSDGSSSNDGVCPEGTSITGPVLLYLQQAGIGDLSVEEAGTQSIDTDEVAVFIQDKWDVSPTLTLQYGMRWEAQYQPDPITPANEVFYAPFIGTTSRGFEFPSDGTIPSDDKMFQPRFGLTWDPMGNAKDVIRFSAGIYFARTPGLALASTRSTNGSLGQTIFRNSALRNILGPTPVYTELLPTDETGDPFRPDVFVFDKDFRNPKSTILSLTYDKELATDLAAFIKLTYIKGEHQTRFINMNDPALIQDREDGEDASLGPWSTGLGDGGFNGVGALTTVESGGESRYRSATIGVTKLMSNNWQLHGSYTYAKDESHDDNERDPFTTRYANVNHLDDEWSYSDRDQRHKLNAMINWQAPYGFDVNCRYSYRSAQPKSILPDGSDANAPTDRYDPVTDTVFPRNTGRKDNAYRSLDIRIARVFDLGSFSLEGVFEVFNAFNSKNLLAPSVTNLIFNFDGTVQSGAGIPRQMQLGVKARW